MSIILSKILGLYLLSIGIAILFNAKRFKALYQKLAQNNSFCFLGGVLALFFGSFVISVHNNWLLAWPLAVTIIGWLSLIKGFWLLTCFKCKEFFTFMSKRPNGCFRMMGILVSLLGIFFIYKGWW